MKVFALVEIETTPYGERMGVGRTIKLFMNEEKAKAYKKEMVRDLLFGPNRGPVGTYEVRSFYVEE